MHFTFVHGWGFDASIWDDVAARLPGADIARVDLGFFGHPTREDWPDATIAVGHSLGLAWLLKEGRQRFRGLVSLQGFDRFCPHVPANRVAGMQRSLNRDAPGTLAAFWRSCGAEGFLTPDTSNGARLAEGLDWLMQWDLRDARSALTCPVRVIAARDDAIVPEAMTRAIWGEDVLWSAVGGHALPLKRPDWCAGALLDFARELG